ncbi:MAG: sulfatase-like hydrolase/transferase [Oscillospiraceae bacterium]|nr:sulfatase-like hydrolase/transferase [Oscillospiraceae bacterium]
MNNFAKPGSRPNIIFYFSDQQRWDTMGCYGQTLPVTPNLDRIAAQGTLFTGAFTCQPVCGPARACLQTGQYATSSGCFTNGISLPLGAKTIARYFDSAGYDTAYVGKWHLASDREANKYETSAVPEERRGGYKDYWMAADVLEFTSHGYNGYVFDKDCNKVNFTGYRADCINNYAIDYVRNHGQERPFFMFVSQIEPHHQNDRNRFEGPDGSKRRFADYAVPGDLAGTGGDWRENYPDYLGCCAALDANVGRLFDSLEDCGMLDNTIFVYTSDHGSHFCTRNGEYKRACHDGCTHIPMIVRGPGFMGGNVIDELVSLIDMPATLLDCGGIDVPEHFHGRPLGRMINENGAGAGVGAGAGAGAGTGAGAGAGSGTGAVWDDSVFIQISESHVGRCVRTKKWKYSVRADADGWAVPGADVYYEDFLYDLENDPHEKTNLAKSPAHAADRSALAKKLTDHMARAGEAPPTILPSRDE